MENGAGSWRCDICSEVFSRKDAFQEHWDSEMAMALDGVHPAETNKGTLAAKFKIRKPPSCEKKVPFRSCFGTEDGADEEAKKRSPVAAARFCFDARAQCPLCNKSFTAPEALQHHVEDELQNMEASQAAPDSISGEDSDKVTGGAHKLNRESTNKGMLILGDVPRPRKRPRLQQQLGRCPSSHFNHYADGKGWWNEDHLGFDFDNGGGPQLSWEGFGSVVLGGLGSAP